MEETNKYLVTLDPRLGVVHKAEKLGSAGELADVPAEAFSVDVAKLTRPATSTGGLSVTEEPEAPPAPDADPPPAPHQPLAPDPSPPPAPHS